MDTYDLDYCLSQLRQAIDYAEMDGDFQPARKWLNEVETAAKKDGQIDESVLVAFQALCEQYPRENPVALWEMAGGQTGSEGVPQSDGIKDGVSSPEWWKAQQERAL